MKTTFYQEIYRKNVYAFYPFQKSLIGWLNSKKLFDDNDDDDYDDVEAK